jgi:MOSC domain-containing protein YiiM
MKPVSTVEPVSKNARRKPSAKEPKRVGKVVGVCISQRKSDPKKNVGKGLLRKGLGLVGDSHAGTEKEVSLLAIESLHKLCGETGISAEPGSFAENITTEGMDLTSLPVGSQLQVGEAKLTIVQIGKDPSQPHTYYYQGYSLLPTEGVFCKVIESGEVKVGDPIRWIMD